MYQWCICIIRIYIPILQYCRYRFHYFCLADIWTDDQFRCKAVAKQQKHPLRTVQSQGPCPSHPFPAQVHPIFMLSVADFFVATLWLIGAAVTMVNPAYIEFCYFSGILTTVRSTKHHATHGLYIVAPHNPWAIYSSTTQPMGYVLYMVW